MPSYALVFQRWVSASYLWKQIVLLLFLVNQQLWDKTMKLVNTSFSYTSGISQKPVRNNLLHLCEGLIFVIPPLKSGAKVGSSRPTRQHAQVRTTFLVFLCKDMARIHNIQPYAHLCAVAVSLVIWYNMVKYRYASMKSQHT